jgi:hypothetical protein
MKTSLLKKQLHLAIDRIDDESLLEAVYVILNKSSYAYQLTAEQEKELYKRLDDHEKGITPSIPMKKTIKKIREKFKK